MPAGISGGSFSAMTIAITAAPASETIITVRGPTLSEMIPPIGRAMTAAMAKPAVRVPAARQVEVVDVLEVGRQVGREGDEAAEGDGVQEGHLPGHGELRRRGELGHHRVGVRCQSGESRIINQTMTADHGQRDRDDHVGGDVAEPADQPRGEEGRQGGAAHAGAEDAGGEAAAGLRYHALTKGMPIANVVPAIPSRKPKSQQQPVGLQRPGQATSSTGTIETNSMIVNITRPP